MGKDALNKILKAVTPAKNSPPLLEKYCSGLSPRDEKRFEGHCTVFRPKNRKKK